MPLRLQAQRFGFVALLSMAFGLMVFGRIEAPLVERFRASVSDTFVPVLSFLSHPIGSVRDAASTMTRLTMQGLIALMDRQELATFPIMQD